ncbi:MAG: DUF4188 domain-containing protein [Anaerolineae bacterium]
MSAVINDRYTAKMDQPFVVFLVGARINKPLQFRKWGLVVNAFPEMLKSLYAHPEKGFLGGENFFRAFPIASVLISYWRSFEDLERFARAKDDAHLPAWRRFNKEIGYDGSVGVWHETYMVQPQAQEALYANMPLFGLAKATGQSIPVRSGYRNDARGRMKGENVEPLPDSLRVEEYISQAH